MQFSTGRTSALFPGLLCITPHYVLYRSCVLHLITYCIVIPIGIVCIVYCTPSIYSQESFLTYYIVFVPHYFLYVLASIAHMS